MSASSPVREAAEAGWAWTLDQVVRDDEGLLLPGTVVAGEPPEADGPRAGLHSGLGGLGLVLAEVRRTRPWTPREADLAHEVVEAVRADVEETTDCSWFDGLPGHAEVLTALGAGGVDRVVSRLLELATPTGWPTAVLLPPRWAEEARVTDVTLGTAGVLRAATAARASGVAGAEELARRAAAVLEAEVETDDHGPTWPHAPHRFRLDPTPPAEMPNWSHGAAGVAHALVEAGVALGRPDWVDLGARAAARLVALADTGPDGGLLRVPSTIPLQRPEDPLPAYAMGWCHGPTGTQQLFGALGRAGVTEVAGESPATWVARCWDTVEASGVPARGEPGEWDNDGWCCGTAGVGAHAVAAGRHRLAVACAQALVDRAVVAGPGGQVCWRFVEHTAEDPLLPPRPGYMQRSAGIVAFLLAAERAGLGRAVSRRR
ncbi:hypothetical protein [Nocardioides litoris]|uniref:hypothetical protein n=1 Tax=Nocardioides litoris TaxID=1926648 RepID=UPI001123C646|nr:hypothetical protein [Nocardioides litoris]